MVIVWRVTEKCNLACPFCAYDRDLERSRAETDLDTVLAFGPVLADYARRSSNGVLISWIGGEPLLWPHLFTATEAFRSLFNVKVSTTTNGTSLSSPEVRRHVIEQYAELTVSIDATGEAYERLRGWPEGYRQLRKNIQAFTEERKAAGGGPLLRANVVLMRETIDDFEKLCTELASWGFDELSFNQLGGNDRPGFFREHRLLPDQADRFASVLPAVRSNLFSLGLRLLGSEGYVRRIQATCRNLKLPITDCGPGKDFLFVDERGLVAPCSFTVNDYAVPIKGIISGEDLQDLVRVFAEKRDQQQPAACSDCHSNQIFKKFLEG